MAGSPLRASYSYGQGAKCEVFDSPMNPPSTEHYTPPLRVLICGGDVRPRARCSWSHLVVRPPYLHFIKQLYEYLLSAPCRRFLSMP